MRLQKALNLVRKHPKRRLKCNNARGYGIERKIPLKIIGCIPEL